MNRLNKGISVFLVMIIVATVALIGVGVTYYITKVVPQQKSLACTEEAKVCPDGSAVGRTGPNCEFAQCPDAPLNKGIESIIYKNEKFDYELSYPNSWNVIEAKQPAQYPVSNVDEVLFTGQVQKVTFEGPAEGYSYSRFQIEVLANDSKVSLTEWWNNLLEEDDARIIECRKEKDADCHLSLREGLESEIYTTFKNQEAVETSEFGGDCSIECIRVEKNYYIYNLCYCAEGEKDSSLGIYNQMLSTFRFTN